jgi:GTP-binding protein Era
MASFRSGFVGVLGQTNVGKSTFLNAVMGTKLLATSPKPQTTRNRVRCVYTTDQAQIVFVDTPGLHHPRNKLGRHVQREALRALRGLDLVVYMIEPWGRVRRPDQLALERVTSADRPTLLLVNKIDLARSNDLEETLLAYDGLGLFAELVPISAERRTNLDDALRTIINYLPQREAVFPAEVKTDSAEEFLIGELIREKVIRHTTQEIPYATAVRVKWLTTDASGLVDIRAEIVVEKESQKGIIIGAGARMIKQIGTEAREDIESLLGARVFLDMRVRVEKGWTQDDRAIDELAGDRTAAGG